MQLRLRVGSRGGGTLRCERGHSGLEILLLLPFIFLIIAMLINLGHLHRTRIRMNSATHVASLGYAGLRSDGATEADAKDKATKYVTDNYYDDVQVTLNSGPPTLTLQEGEASIEQGDDPGGKAWDFVDLYFPIKKSQQRATLERTVDPPMFSAGFPNRQMKASMTLHASTWTFNEWDLFYGTQDYSDDSGFGISDLADFFRWPFGMSGKIGCDRTKKK